MITNMKVMIDTDCGFCVVQEEHAEPVAYHIDTSSLESIAYDVGRAVNDYLCGFD